MRKHIKTIIIILILSAFAFLAYNIVQKIQHKNEVAERIKTIPNFSFVTLNDIPFSEKELSKNTNKLFVYFNTECDFCQHEAQQISEQLEQFKKTQIVFVSFEEIEIIKDFAEKHNISNKDNVLFLQDKKLEFSEIFDAKSIPFILLYNADNKLIEKFKGAMKIEKIIELL